MNRQRCDWCSDDPLYIAYHDNEWGVPLHDENRLFEMLTLEGAQAGLSWLTVLKKRQNYRQAFDQFDAAEIAGYGPAKISDLLNNQGIIRNRLKIESAIRNARAVLQIRTEFGSLDSYLWRFVDGRPQQNHWQSLDQLPASSPLSEKLSKDLKQRGCNFVGPTIMYAFMQAIGMVNDHLVDCFRHSQLSNSCSDYSA
jgi:DNA-3-methyladenine glycosylase I